MAEMLVLWRVQTYHRAFAAWVPVLDWRITSPMASQARLGYRKSAGGIFDPARGRWGCVKNWGKMGMCGWYLGWGIERANHPKQFYC